MSVHDRPNGQDHQKQCQTMRQQRRKRRGVHAMNQIRQEGFASVWIESAKPRKGAISDTGLCPKRTETIRETYCQNAFRRACSQRCCASSLGGRKSRRRRRMLRSSSYDIDQGEGKERLSCAKSSERPVMLTPSPPRDALERAVGYKPRLERLRKNVETVA